MTKVNKLPKISIVMPCFNASLYIERSINSVVDQDYPNTELFIKDGGSTDGTLEIIKKYVKKYPKLISFISKKDSGQADAINFGMKKVKGDILTYLNADDLYKKNTLKKIAKYFSLNPEKMWVYGKCDIINGADQPIRGAITFYKNIFLSNYSYQTLLILNYISQMAVFWTRQASLQVGEFDKDQHYVMDYDFWLRLGRKFTPGVINEYLASFRVVPQTKSSTGFIKQFKDELTVAKRYTNNSLILSLHKVHNYFITQIYTLTNSA